MSLLLAGEPLVKDVGGIPCMVYTPGVGIEYG